MMHTRDDGSSQEGKLTARDWLAMLAVACVTVAVIAGGTELISRRLYPKSGEVSVDSCLVENDPATSARGIPNAFCRVKSYEDPAPIEYKFNSCGHRSEMECGPKNPGVYRIVMLGSSIAMAEHVQEKDSMAALLPKELSSAVGHPVELYNEGMGYSFSHSTTLRFNDAISEKPDLILWILTPMDIRSAAVIVPSGAPSPVASDPALSPWARAMRRIKYEFGGESPMKAITAVFGRTRSSLLLQHLVFSSETQYVASYLIGDPKDVTYMQVQQTAAWQKQLDQFDEDAANIESRAKAAGIPLVAVFLPDRAQADLISMGQWPKEIDPYKLDNQLRPIIESHGGTYVDILQEFRSVPNPGQYYLPIDGHPMAGAHRLFADFIARALTGGAVPALNRPAPASVPESGGPRKQGS